MSYLGYGNAVFAPKIYSPGEKIYVAAHHIILAHAKAYRAYKNKSQNGIYRSDSFVSVRRYKPLTGNTVHKVTFQTGIYSRWRNT